MIAKVGEARRKVAMGLGDAQFRAEGLELGGSSRSANADDGARWQGRKVYRRRAGQEHQGIAASEYGADLDEAAAFVGAGRSLA
ncbi:hypothetical protein GCM10017688_02460 [Streptomyces ramulosus]